MSKPTPDSPLLDHCKQLYNQLKYALQCFDAMNYFGGHWTQQAVRRGFVEDLENAKQAISKASGGE